MSKSLRDWRRVVRSLRVPASAPGGLFLVHLLFAEALSVYDRWPWVDQPMHFFGGMAMAWFLARGFDLAFEGGIPSRTAFGLLVSTATVTVAVLWEFWEFLSDRYLGTRAQAGIPDTLRDLLLGALGSLGVALGTARRRPTSQPAVRS